LFSNANLGRHLYKRLRRPAASEIELKQKFKKTYENKEQFKQNRRLRNAEYILQRKRDFSVSQQRVAELIAKLKSEYEADVSEQLRRHSDWVSRTNSDASTLISTFSESASRRICDAAVQLSMVSDALSFIPTFYSSITKYFHESGLDFRRDSPEIPRFSVLEYRRPLRPETQRVLVTLCEGCRQGSMIPAIVSRKCRTACVLMKPLVFTEAACAQLAEAVGWKGVFWKDSVDGLFSFLCESSDDVIVFGFPRTPEAFDDLARLFNPQLSQEGFLPHPKASVIEPFDGIIELDIDDEIVIRDGVAQFEDPEDGSRYDVRELCLDTETQLQRLRHVPDPHFDIEQYSIRSATLKSNFELISECHAGLYHRISLPSRLVTQEVISGVQSIVDSLKDPEAPTYNPEAIHGTLLPSVASLSDELKEFFNFQWNQIESTYSESVLRGFEILNETHQTMISHLDRSREEMKQFLVRPGSSQHLIIEFQQWHCSQVERCMRRMQRVKDECYLRLGTLREQLLQIENERKTEEEARQKELTNATLRSTLFEFVNNACTILAQAELDRWTSTRVLMIDFNQVISDVDLVPALPHKKLNQLIDPSRAAQRKGVKKPPRTTSVSRNRVENRLQPFESPLFEQLEGMKKFISDASVIYVRATTPISNRARGRPIKDKNPFAAHKISALEEFLGGFSDDDVYFIARLDEIAEIAREEIQVIQQAFDAFVDDSTRWIQEHFERRKAIVDTAIAYLISKVNEEAQLNHLVILEEDECVVDLRQLLVPNEEVPKVPTPFPADMTQDIAGWSPEAFMRRVVDFVNEANAQ
jgi:hypothetical protein